ncbi:hypothetical protein F383_18261 [Gossypium arboreum]|uniref:Uncharacterized protein n=1 Tax=Gossypium arboreum TaxID=29729 RepID=A0A0B0NG48_GOSAR|nr:hypothetical protein F383_18261 [Gossypium arboreum]
MAHKLNFIN